MRKNKKITLQDIEILDFAAEGKCILRNEGEVIFVDGANLMPGDIVDVLVTKSKKNYAEGRVLKVKIPSKDRIQPFCSHFGVCGGCKWQHVPYETQLAQKQKQVADQLQRIGKLDIQFFEPILGSAKNQFYRNKLEFTFSNTRWMTHEEIASDNEITDKNGLGFHVPRRFDKVIPIDKCYLQDDPSNPIRDFFNEYAHQNGLPFYDHVAHQGFFRTLMIRTTSTGQTMVAVQFAQNNLPEIKKVLDLFIAKFSNIRSLMYFVNEKRNDTYFDLEPVLYHGFDFIEEKMEDLHFKIGVKSFYQTNSEQAYELYKITRDFADIQPTDVVYDLYTGTGTIANFVAKKAAKVIGIEYVEMAIEDAKQNSITNNIHNTYFIAGDMAKIFNDELVAEHGRPNIVITDPPRAGMDKKVVETLLNAAPDKIVYVSCNPATQARDLQLLSEKYEISRVKPVDMFPHTFHVENVALLTLK